MRVASNTIPPVTTEREDTDRPLTREEGWDLIFSLFGTAKDAYAEVGGAEAWMRSERAAWNEKDASS